MHTSVHQDLVWIKEVDLVEDGLFGLGDGLVLYDEKSLHLNTVTERQHKTQMDTTSSFCLCSDDWDKDGKKDEREGRVTSKRLWERKCGMKVNRERVT